MLEIIRNLYITTWCDDDYFSRDSIEKLVALTIDQGFGGIVLEPQHCEYINGIDRLPDIHLSIDAANGFNDIDVKERMIDYYWGLYSHKLKGITCFINNHDAITNNIDRIVHDVHKLSHDRQIPIHHVLDTDLIDSQNINKIVSRLCGTIKSTDIIILNCNSSSIDIPINLRSNLGNHFGVYNLMNFEQQDILSIIQNKINPIYISLKNIAYLFDTN